MQCFNLKNILGEKGGVSEIHLRKTNRFRSELRIYLYNTMCHTRHAI